MKGNIIVGQSGGPTAAINSSLAGVYRTAIDRGAKKVYGMRHGIQGLLNEDYIDCSFSRKMQNIFASFAKNYFKNRKRTF